MAKIITFIIPAYNAQRYLKKALDSMIHMDCLEETEIIVVNDGSHDQTEEIAAEYVKRYPNSIFLLNKENGGHGSAINAGTLKATGKYFKVIDADDWIVTENLPAFIQTLRSCTADVVLTPFHQVNMVDGSKSDWRMYCETYETVCTFDKIIQHWKDFDRCLTFHGITYNREFYNRYRYELPEKIFYEDQEYAAIPCCHASSVYVLNLYIYQYMVGNSEQSVSAENRLKRISHVEWVTKDLLIYWKDCKDLTDSGKEYLLRKIEGVILSHYVVTCIIQKDKRNGRKNAERYNQMIRETVPSVFERIEKKYKAYYMLNRIHMPFVLYEALLRSKLYSTIRKSHRIEKG